MGAVSRFWWMAIVLGVSAVIVTPTASSASVAYTYYASASGSGSTCSQAAPCSLSGAQAKVQSVVGSAAGDVVVNLEPGTYDLSSGMTFTAADSGHGSNNVIWRADPATASPTQTVNFSAGTSITNWSVYDASKNIWSASVPASFDTRQLYVNGQRATVDSVDAPAVFAGLAKTSTGYTYTNTGGTGPDSWTQTNNANLVYDGGVGTGANAYHWTYSVCPVSSIGATSGVIAMATGSGACFTDGNATLNFQYPTAVENVFALLNSPGTFYLDKVADKVYYIPRPGENLATANVVGAGRTALSDDALMILNGTASAPVRNLEFSGITFEYATWIFDGRGVADAQANGLVNSNNVLDQRMLPGAVMCHSCQGVQFLGNTFSHLGGSGLNFDGNGIGNTVKGNVVTDTSGNGIDLGTTYNLTSNGQPAYYEVGDTVSDNYVYDIGVEYIGAVGIFAGWVSNTTIDHNEVADVSYSGISLGWGAGSPYHAPSNMVNNHIDYNYVHDVMTTDMVDGAGIYTNGTENPTPGSSIAHNYISGVGSNGDGIGLDNGSSYFTVENNYLGGYAPNWLGINLGDPPAVNNIIQNNLIGPREGPYANGSSWGSNTASGNLANQSPTDAASIISAAGLEPQYWDIVTEGAPANASPNATVTVSSTLASPYSGSMAIDGSSQSFWSSAVGDATPWIQLDLGSVQNLSRVELLFRQDLNSPNERNNFLVKLSADGSAWTTVCQQGTLPAQTQSRYDCVFPAGAWRYVKLAENAPTYTHGLSVAELRAYGTPTNINMPQVLDSTGSAWVHMPGTAIKAAVDANGNPWIIDSKHQVMHWSGGGWALTPTIEYANDIAIGANGTIAISRQSDSEILVSSDGGATWTDKSGQGTSVAVGASGNPWTVGATGTLWAYSSGSWSASTTPCGSSGVVDVAVQGVTIAVTCGGASQYVYKYNGTSWSSALGSGVRVALSSDGTLWVTNSIGRVWKMSTGGSWTMVKAGGAADIGANPTGSQAVWIAGNY